jgi:hypothetical protein
MLDRLAERYRREEGLDVEFDQGSLTPWLTSRAGCSESRRRWERLINDNLVWPLVVYRSLTGGNGKRRRLRVRVAGGAVEVTEKGEEQTDV